MKKLAVLALAVTSSLAVAAPAPALTIVRVADDVFRPASLTVRAGSSVRWRWVGDNPHNVTVRSGPSKFNSGTKRSGRYTKRIRRGGTYRIVCTIHPDMRMTLRAR